MTDEEINKTVELFPHSIEITKGQKGGYGYTVKVRFPDGKTPEEMVTYTKLLTDKLEDQYKSEGGK